MIKKILGIFAVLLLIFLCGEVARAAWKWKRGTKKVTGDKILIKITGKSTKLKLGTNPVYIRGPEGDFRIVSYAWGAYSILGYSAPQISQAFCLSRVSGEGGYEVASHFFVIGDVDGDGYRDIACADKRHMKRLLVFSGKDGSKLRNYILAEKGYWHDKPGQILATYDHNGDGVEDFFTHTGKSLLLISTKDGNVLKTITFPMYASRSINDLEIHRAPDLDGDGMEDVLLSGGVDMGNAVHIELLGKKLACVYFLSSKTGQLLNFTTLRLKFAPNQKYKYMRGSRLVAIRVIDDITKDGFPDLIATDSLDGRPEGHSVLLALSGKNGKEIWRIDGSRIKGGTKVEVLDAEKIEKGGRYTEPGFGTGLLVYPDINGDGIQEVIAGTPMVHNREIKGWGCLFVFSGKDGSLLKHTWLPEAKGYVGIYLDTFPDMDGDKLPEIMLGVPSSDIGAPEGGAILVISSKMIK